MQKSMMIPGRVVGHPFRFYISGGLKPTANRASGEILHAGSEPGPVRERAPRPIGGKHAYVTRARGMCSFRAICEYLKAKPETCASIPWGQRMIGQAVRFLQGKKRFFPLTGISGAISMHMKKCVVRFRHFFGIALVAVSALAGTDTVTITVHEGSRHEFMGFGASSVNRGQYELLPEEARRQMAAMVWKGLDARVLRLWSVIGEYDAQYFVGRFNLVIEEARAHQPELLLLMAPDMRGNAGFDTIQTREDIARYAQGYARLIKKLRDTYGLRIHATGICNEPNDFTRMLAWHIPLVVKSFRAELDMRGLQDVKIIAPETSNVDHVAREMVDSIAADSAALAALDGFATHSYNMCLTKEMRDKVAPYGKQYWQTEASSSDPEDFNNSAEAVKAAARFLSDVNLGVNYWLWFIAYNQFRPYCNTPCLIGYDVATGQYRAFLKYYYFRQIKGAFPVGTLLRFATSSLSYEKDTRYGKDRYKYMENRANQKPPLCAAAGVGPDSTWALAVANQTGIVSFWDKAWYCTSTAYDVRFVVEELRDSAEIVFDVHRSSEDMRDSVTGTATMRNGEVRVSAAPHELVTLTSNLRYSGRSVYCTYDKKNSVSPRERPSLSVRCGPNRQPEITIYQSARYKNMRLHVAAYDLCGRKVAELINGPVAEGRHAIVWHGTDKRPRLQSGIYAIKLRCSDVQRSARLIVR
jgi:hypothetical protein